MKGTIYSLVLNVGRNRWRWQVMDRRYHYTIASGTVTGCKHKAEGIGMERSHEAWRQEIEFRHQQIATM